MVMLLTKIFWRDSCRLPPLFNWQAVFRVRVMHWVDLVRRHLVIGDARQLDHPLDGYAPATPLGDRHRGFHFASGDQLSG